MRPLLKTPITYYGGKQRMLPHILPLIPNHDIYTESFLGGGAVYWAKAPAKVEVINDTSGAVVAFFRVLKGDFDALQGELELTLHSRSLYEDALHVLERPHLFSDLKLAWAFWVGTNMGFGSKINAFGYDRSGKTTAMLRTKLMGLGPHLSERLRLTQIECGDALRVIRSRDTAGTFHYVDPPYFNSDCGHYKGYAQEDFAELLTCLAGIKGRFLLSSYPSELLDRFVGTHGWEQHIVRRQVAVDARRRSPKFKEEVLTWNYPVPAPDQEEGQP